MPTAVAVPREAQIGTLLTAWASTPATPNWWTCSATVQEQIGAGIWPLVTELSGTTIVDGGATYPVFKTNLPGVGIAMGSKLYANGCGWESAWSPVAGGRSYGCNSPDLRPNGGQLRAVLVKIGAITSGQVSAGPIAQGKLYANAAWDTKWPITIATTVTQVTVLSCATPDVLVNLGPHKSSEFKGPGTFTSMTGFNVALKSCPAGINRVNYQIDAATPVVNAANSVVALDSGSTATGVGVQLLDGSGNVFPLATPKNLGGYGTSAGGDYAIPFNARYYQTGPTVGAGSANTAMTFTMSYE
jgi:major type 1 subunit fimbrin (pilin)